MAPLPHAQQTSAIYMLEGPGGYIAYINDGLHPLNAGAIGGESDGVTGLDGAPVRESAATLTEAHGGVHGMFWMDRRPITLTVETVASSIDGRNLTLETLRRAVKGMNTDVTLRWFPGDPSVVPVTRINEVRNPSFEYDTAGTAAFDWTDISAAQYTGKTFAVAAANPSVGTNALRWTATKDATATSRVIAVTSSAGGTAAFPIIPSQTYSASVQLNIINALASGTGFNLSVLWYDANGTFIAAQSGATLAVGASGVQTISIANVTAPSWAAYAQLQITGASTGSSDVVDIYIDAAQLVAESAVGAYVDGDQANSSWLGIPGQSKSVNRPAGKAVAARMQQPPRQTGVGWKKNTLLGLVTADPRIYSSVQYNIKAMAANTPTTIENQGDEEAPPNLIQVTGPGVLSDVRITAWGVTRKYAFTGLTLAANEVLVIKPRTREMYINQAGVFNRYAYQYEDFANTTWWGVMPGATNIIQTTFASGNTGASTTQFQWQDCWA